MTDAPCSSRSSAAERSSLNTEGTSLWSTSPVRWWPIWATRTVSYLSPVGGQAAAGHRDGATGPGHRWVIPGVGGGLPFRGALPHRGVCELLHRAGLTQSALQCPADLPYGAAARDAFLAAGSHPAPVVMNCSGKHAAMLWTCVINGWGRGLPPAGPPIAAVPARHHRVAGRGPGRADQHRRLWGSAVRASGRSGPGVAGDAVHAFRGAGRCGDAGVSGVRRRHRPRRHPLDARVCRDWLPRTAPRRCRRWSSTWMVAGSESASRSRTARNGPGRSWRGGPLEALGMVTPVTVEHRRQTVLGGGRPVGWIAASAALDGLRVGAHCAPVGM